jgi:phosphate transport system permease protein
MAAGTDAAERAVEGFGQVSRTAGRVFRAVLLAATLVGIVALAVLLAYVVNDAVQPSTADPGYYGVFAATLVAPAVGVGASLYRRNPDAVWVGLGALAVPVIGLLFGAGAALLFVNIVPPLAWFAYVLALAIPVAVGWWLSRRDLSFLPWLGATLAVFAVSVAVVPGLVLDAPFVPDAWLVMALTLGGPAALLARWFAADRWERDRTADIAGVAAFAGVIAAAFVAPLVGLTPLPAVVLAAFAAVPTGLYLAVTVAHRPVDRVGLLLAAVVVAGALLGGVATDLLGVAGPQSWVDWQFLTSSHNNTAADAGLYPAIAGSAMLMLIVALVAFPVGTGAAIYLEEYAPDNAATRVIQVNIANLAGVPSVVYGLLGLGFFVTYLGDGIALPPRFFADLVGVSPVVVGQGMLSGGTVLVGGLTLSLLILPIVIISAQEAIRSVPDDIRQASYGMGATKWQTVRNVVLPRAVPGILTGTILALGRAIGETAPLIVILAPNVFDLPDSLSSSVGAMPLQVYAWAKLFASEEFWYRAVPAGVVVLLVTLLTLNSVAIVVRNRYQTEE